MDINGKEIVLILLLLLVVAGLAFFLMARPVHGALPM